jgi:hypothetical protein
LAARSELSGQLAAQPAMSGYAMRSANPSRVPSAQPALEGVPSPAAVQQVLTA